MMVGLFTFGKFLTLLVYFLCSCDWNTSPTPPALPEQCGDIHILYTINYFETNKLVLQVALALVMLAKKTLNINNF